MPDRLTTNQGAAVPDNQHSLTAGRRGPTLVTDHHLIEKLAHFDRERIPERVVNARGAAAFGTFRLTNPLPQFTKAAVFARDATTPVGARFSTFIHSKGSPETLRDPRGFAVKFYTSQGNYDLVGSSLPVSFIRDAMKFPDLVHAMKPDPATGVQDPNRIFDFLNFVPEATHMLVWLYSDLGIPKGYRHMLGFGVHAFVWINERDEARYVKYHWKPVAGIESFTAPEAAAMQAKDFSHATRDLWSTLRTGAVVEYDLYVQVMETSDELELTWDPVDATKTWPEERWPLALVGRMTLNRAPLNEFAESEQFAVTPSALVPGVELSPDKLLQGRAFAYPDTQRHRLGANYLQLPVNRPRVAVHNQQQDGPMAIDFSSSGVNYEPNGAHEHEQSGDPARWQLTIAGTVTREKIPNPDDFTQAGETWRGLIPALRFSVVRNLGDELARVRDQKIVSTIIGFLTQADAPLGELVRRRARGELDDAALAALQTAEPAPAGASE